MSISERLRRPLDAALRRRSAVFDLFPPSTEEFGAYVLLLMDYWSNGPLPADDRKLLQITRLRPAAWRKLKQELQGFFEERDGKWFQSRSDRELEKARELGQRRTQKARKAANQRWGADRLEHSSSSARGMLGACPPQPLLHSVPKGTATERSDLKKAFKSGVWLRRLMASLRNGQERSLQNGPSRTPQATFFPPLAQLSTVKRLIHLVPDKIMSQSVGGSSSPRSFLDVVTEELEWEERNRSGSSSACLATSWKRLD